MYKKYKKEKKCKYDTSNDLYDDDFEFEDRETLKCGIFGMVTGVQNGYTHLDLGMGNHLFVKDVINKKFQNEIKNIHENFILYSN